MSLNKSPFWLLLDNLKYSELLNVHTHLHTLHTYSRPDHIHFCISIFITVFSNVCNYIIRFIMNIFIVLMYLITKVMS